MMEAKLIDDYKLLKSFLEKTHHCLFHTPEFAEFISKAFSCRYIFCVATDNNEIKTILPVVAIKSKVFGNKIISSGYIEYGGFAGDPRGVPKIIEYLDQIYGRENNYLEIRGSINDPEEFEEILSQNEKIKQINLYKRFVLDLKPKHLEKESESQISMSSIFKTVTFSSGSVPAVKWFRSNTQKSKRKAIKKAERSNVKVKDVPISDLDALYNLYCRNMRLFGSPPYSKRYFSTFYKYLVSNGMGKVLGSYLDGELISVLLGFCYRDRVHILIAVSESEKSEYRSNDAVHSEFIEWAIEHNYKYFDFGRVREESGQFEYKQKWGPELLDLPSYFLLWKSKEIPFVDPQSEKYKLATRVWKRLPLILTKKIGPRLRKELGI